MTQIFERFTAAELQASKFNPLQYTCEPVIAPGATLLAGRPKTNKTWFCQELAFAIADGGMACGAWPCQQGDVLFFALEDNKRRIQRRAMMLRPDGLWPQRLQFQIGAPHLGHGFEALVRCWAQGVSAPKAVFVDTFQFIRPPTTNRQLYKSDYADSARLSLLANELGIAIVAIHHTRKMEAEDPLDAVSGTTGIAAGFDSIFALTRTSAGGFKLEGRGRDIKSVEIALGFDGENARWTIEGDAAIAQASAQRKAILAAIEIAGRSGPKGIAEQTGVGHDVVRKLLPQMVKAGQILKPERGIYAPVHNGHNGHIRHSL